MGMGRVERAFFFGCLQPALTSLFVLVFGVCLLPILSGWLADGLVM